MDIYKRPYILFQKTKKTTTVSTPHKTFSFSNKSFFIYDESYIQSKKKTKPVFSFVKIVPDLFIFAKWNVQKMEQKNERLQISSQEFNYLCVTSTIANWVFKFIPFISPVASFSIQTIFGHSRDTIYYSCLNMRWLEIEAKKKEISKNRECKLFRFHFYFFEGVM